MFFLFDIGGTKMRFAVTDDCVECTEPEVISSPDSYEEALDIITDAKERLSGGQKVTAACGGTSGTFNKNRTVIEYAPNNQDWVGRSYHADLEDRLRVPVHVDNDTAVNALGEAHHGAGRGHDIVAYMTISTGVGGSRVVNGKPDGKSRSFEPGHQYILCSRPENDDPQYETLESLVSGTAVEKRQGKPAYDVSQDDPLWNRLCHQLGVGVYNTMLHWSPDVMVLGGSMITGNPAIPIEGIKNHIREQSESLANLCTITMAELGDYNGVYGAMAWANQIYGSD